MSGHPGPPVSLLVCCKVSHSPSHAGAQPRGGSWGGGRGATLHQLVRASREANPVESEPACPPAAGCFAGPGCVPSGLSRVSRSVGILRSQGPHHTDTVKVSRAGLDDRLQGVVPGLAPVLWLVTTEATVPAPHRCPGLPSLLSTAKCRSQTTFLSGAHRSQLPAEGSPEPSAEGHRPLTPVFRGRRSSHQLHFLILALPRLPGGN